MAWSAKEMAASWELEEGRDRDRRVDLQELRKEAGEEGAQEEGELVVSFS